MTVTPTIVDRLVERAARAPSDVLITLVDDDGQDEGWLTAAGLHEAARRVAAHLLGPAGLQPGDRVMLVYLPSLEFVTALAGCLMAGVVAVPVAPPDPIRPGADLARFATLARNAGARHALTHNVYHRARTLGRLRNLVFKPATGWPELSWVVTDALKAPRDDVALPRTGPTIWRSSSTPPARPGRRSGVMITHGNLAHQLDCNAAELDCRTDARAVIWVPHFHDFGLISGILSSLHGNGSLWMLSPLAFIRRPAVWFEVMSRVGATHTAAPNFAYVLSTRKTTPEQRRAWDLSPLEVDDERRRADPAGRRPRLPRRVRAERAAPVGLLPRLRPRRAHGGRVGAWPGDGDGVAAGARARGRCARAGGRRGGEDAGGLRQALAGRDGAGGRSGAARGPRARARRGDLGGLAEQGGRLLRARGGHARDVPRPAARRRSRLSPHGRSRLHPATASSSSAAGSRT